MFSPRFSHFRSFVAAVGTCAQSPILILSARGQMTPTGAKLLWFEVHDVWSVIARAAARGRKRAAAHEYVLSRAALHCAKLRESRLADRLQSLSLAARPHSAGPFARLPVLIDESTNPINPRRFLPSSIMPIIPKTTPSRHRETLRRLRKKMLFSRCSKINTFVCGERTEVGHLNKFMRFPAICLEVTSSK